MWPLPSHQSSILSPSKPNPSPNGQSCFYFAASITVLYPVPSCIASSTQHPHLLGEIVFDSWCSLIILVSAQMLKFFCKYTLDFSLTRMNYFSTLWFISIFSLSSFVLRLIFSLAHSCALFKAPSGHGHSLSAHPIRAVPVFEMSWTFNSWAHVEHCLLHWDSFWNKDPPSNSRGKTSCKHLDCPPMWPTMEKDDPWLPASLTGESRFGGKRSPNAQILIIFCKEELWKPTRNSC